MIINFFQLFFFSTEKATAAAVCELGKNFNFYTCLIIFSSCCLIIFLLFFTLVHHHFADSRKIKQFIVEKSQTSKQLNLTRPVSVDGFTNWSCTQRHSKEADQDKADKVQS